MRNYFSDQVRADQMIQRWGQPSFLRRAGSPDRWCWCYIVDYKPIERIGKLFNPTDRRAIVSPFDRQTGDLLLAPDSDKDMLVTPSLTVAGGYDQLHIIAPVGKIAPGDVVVCWDLQVRK